MIYRDSGIHQFLREHSWDERSKVRNTQQREDLNKAVVPAGVQLQPDLWGAPEHKLYHWVDPTLRQEGCVLYVHVNESLAIGCYLPESPMCNLSMYIQPFFPWMAIFLRKGQLWIINNQLSKQLELYAPSGKGHLSGYQTCQLETSSLSWPVKIPILVPVKPYWIGH